MNTSDELLDPALEAYARRLEEIYTGSELPADLTWQDLRSRPAQTTLPGRRMTALRWVMVHPMHRKPMRVALIMAALAVVLMAAGFAYATGLFSPLLTHDLKSYPGTNSVLANKEFVTINQSKTIDGFTLTLEAAYADANNAVLGYSIKLPAEFKNDGHWWAFGIDSLRTTRGLVLPGLSSVGVRASTDVISYDAGVIQGSPATLQMHAEITFGCDSSEDANGQLNNCSQKATQISKDLHWTFNFSVPFRQGHVINVHQSATDHGVTATLDRVVLTDSGTRVYLNGLPYGQLGQNNDTYFATLYIDHQSYGMYTYNQGGSPEGLFIIFDDVLLGKHGWWVLDVQMQVESPGNQGQPPQMSKGGQWVIHFQVP